MIANYHTHTTRCHHATGADEEYVLAALAAGLRVLGFSDHTPQFYHNGFVHSDKMLPEELDGYVRSVLSLRERYGDRIEILLGLETEYHPEILAPLLDAYRAYPLDYLILGQHAVGHPMTEGAFNAFQQTADPERLRRFFQTETEAIETGLFCYVAHPDVLRFVGDPTLYKAAATPFIRRARELGVALEYNLLGVREGRHYPNPLFWECVAEIGGTVVLGCDAHHPSHLAIPEDLRRAGEALAALGITPQRMLRTTPPRL